MRPRIATAAVGVPLLVALIWVGSPWFSLLAAAAAAVGALEICSMARRSGWRPATQVAIVCSVSPVAVAHIVTADLSPQAALHASIATGVFVYVVWQIHRARGHISLGSWGITLGAALYPGVLLAHAVLLRALSHGREWTLFLVLVTFATDTAAFLVGKGLGRTALAPTVSPGKTWEGAIGGLVAALGASVAATHLLPLTASVVEALVLGALLGVVGQLGDLAESRLKRAAGVKDSGWLIPGHGGLLDRLDSIVFNVPVLYYFVIWVTP